jgi:hypothetical protein
MWVGLLDTRRHPVSHRGLHTTMHRTSTDSILHLDQRKIQGAGVMPGMRYESPYRRTFGTW